MLAMRDSSLDYRTGWIRNGLWYAKQRNKFLGAAGGACAMAPELLQTIPEADRRILLEETEGDPSFCGKVMAAAKSPDFAHKISESAKRAIANELNPKLFPESKGSWPKLRARVRDLMETVPAAIDKAVAKLTLKEKLAIVRKIAAGQVPAQGVAGLGELGQWDIIGSLVGAVSGAAASVYNAKVTAEAQEDIAKLQATAAMQGAQAQMAIASANAAIAQAQAQQAATASPVSSAVASLTTSTVGGVPVLLIAIPVLGAIAYFAFKK